ncbi:MAG: AAA family ATPase [bacterium]
MKLSHVTISNVATFPYIADLHDGSGVNFTVHEKGNIHIFIGPNGAGKSTFLDIIQQVCSSVFFQPYVCNIQHLPNLNKEDSQQLIRHKPVSLHNLHENLAGKGKPSLVFLTFVLNEQDRANMQFVYEHQEEINNLIATYSTSPVRFSYKGIDQYIKSYEQITCKVQLDLLANKGYTLDTHLEDIEHFIYDYCSHFYLLQHCITIHNELDKEKKEYWHSLHATLAVMGSYRNLLHYNDTYTIGEDVHAHMVSDLLQDASAVSIKTAQDHLT